MGDKVQLQLTRISYHAVRIRHIFDAVMCWVFAGKSQTPHKKQGSKAPAPVTTGYADLPVEDVDLLTGIDMTLLHRFALLAAHLKQPHILHTRVEG